MKQDSILEQLSRQADVLYAMLLKELLHPAELANANPLHMMR